MPNIRKFYFENAAGERFGLQGERGVFLTVPEGLGYELDPPWADLGRGFFSPLDEIAEPQGSVAGELVFVPSAYANYRTLMDWLASAGSLLLIYCPYGDAEFQKRVSVQYVQKGELDKTRLLHCPFSLISRSPWRRPVPTEISMDAEETGGYTPRYPGTYPGRYGKDAQGSMSARIAAAGHIPGAVLLRVFGGITDPEIRLTGLTTGTVYGICRLTGATVGASEVLELSTLWEDSYVRKIAADGQETDLLPFLDISQEPFFHAPTDEASSLTVQSDSPFSGSGELLVYAYYRTV